MPEPVISVEHLSKLYILGHQRMKGDGLRHAIEAAIRSPLAWFNGQRKSRKGANEEFWALQDISFQVPQGQIVGIIGRNGAGKSTLLKLLSRITEPTRGRIRITGRVASLLEVGTGFHPELTGRENIFLNGAILGMSKNEIRRKFDEIVAFSEVEKFLDTPVKRYSSGMYVRLAFAVAAHLEPEILVVDEVLAVGDAAFQRKCLGRMRDVARGGRTVLFVSHNMGAISALTSRCLLLNAGSLVLDGTPGECVARYIALSYQQQASWEAPRANDHPMQILRIRVLSEGNSTAGAEFDVSQDTRIEVDYVVRQTVRNAVIAINIHAQDGAHVVSLEDIDQNPERLLGRPTGTYTAGVTLPGSWLNRGSYLLRVGCGAIGGEDWDNIEEISFQLVETGDPLTRGHRKGYLLPMLKWEQRELQQASI